MSKALDQASAELLERLTKEAALPGASGPTRELGGIARTSANLEKLLRLVLEDIAGEQGTTADKLLAESFARARPILLRKATGGQLVVVLSTLCATVAASRSHVRALMRELAVYPNKISRTLDARNDVLHGNKEPAEARTAILSLRVFVETYRRDAGWSPKASASPSAKSRS